MKTVRNEAAETVAWLVEMMESWMDDEKVAELDDMKVVDSVGE